MNKSKNASYKTKLAKRTVPDILNDYAFPHRFLVYFASQCAKDAVAEVKRKHPKVKCDQSTLDAIDIAERFGNGEEFSQDVLLKTANAAHATYATYAVYNAANAATYAYYAANAANAAHYAAANAYYAAAYAANAFKDNAEHYRPLLLSLIETRLSEVERVLILE